MKISEFPTTSYNPYGTATIKSLKPVTKEQKDNFTKTWVTAGDELRKRGVVDGLAVRDSILRCGELIFDTEAGTVTYAKNAPVEVNPQAKALKLLRVLMENKDEIVTFPTLGERIGLEGKVGIQGRVRDVWRETKTILVDKIRVPKEKINEALLNKYGNGYKLKDVL